MEYPLKGFSRVTVIEALCQCVPELGFRDRDRFKRGSAVRVDVIECKNLEKDRHRERLSGDVAEQQADDFDVPSTSGMVAVEVVSEARSVMLARRPRLALGGIAALCALHAQRAR